VGSATAGHAVGVQLGAVGCAIVEDNRKLVKERDGSIRMRESWRSGH